MHKVVMNSKRGGNTDFDTFVKRQQPALEGGQPVDWAKKRDEWLSHLNELYGQVESFLAKYIKIGEIKCSYRNIALNEENIGSYSAREMVLKIGRQEITLTPIGTIVLGAEGRVDVEGPAGRTRFLLVDSRVSGPTIRVTKKIKRVWKIATSPPTIQYIELTPESLFQALMELANG
ncbi:MAG: hypothetical protein ACLQOO_11200 [Terriglobia bacterium]